MADGELDLAGTRERVDRLRTAWTSEPDVRALEHAGPALLRWLERQRVALKQRAAGPADAELDEGLVADGIELADLAEGAAALFAAARLVELEESARGICVNMTCAVQGHLHHVVGPRMLAFLDCLVHQGRMDQSLAVTDAIVADFGWILREWADREDGPTEEDRVSLRVLRRALELQAEQRDDPQLGPRIDRIGQVLGRPAARMETLGPDGNLRAVDPSP